jgi:hypothetical protein
LSDENPGLRPPGIAALILGLGGREPFAVHPRNVVYSRRRQDFRQNGMDPDVVDFLQYGASRILLRMDNKELYRISGLSGRNHMNLWRCLGISFFLLGALCLISTTKYPGDAHAQEKGKDVEKKTDGKTDDPKKKADPKEEEKKKTDAKEDKKPEVKKEEKKAEVKEDKLPLNIFTGKPYFQVQKTETNQKMTVMNQTVEQKQKQTFLIQWTPKDKVGDNYVVTQKIVGVKMEIDIGGNKIAYDSTIANPKNPMTDFFEQLTKDKSELTFFISAKDLKVQKVEGREDFIKGLSDINPQMQSLLKAILSAKALEKMAEPVWWAYPPTGKLDKGQTWSKTSDLDLGPIGTYKTTFDFTYKGPKDGKDIITFKTKLEFSAPGPDSKSGLPFTIHEAKLSSESGEGEAVFDPAKGRFDSSKINSKLKGQLKIEVGNMTTTVDLDQSQDASSETSDANPWQKK